MRVAVFGATGTVGGALLPALARAHDVVAVSRHERSGDDVTWVKADANDASSVRRALDGVDVAYYLVHSLGAQDFEERDRAAARTVAGEAERAGLSQLVYLGGLGDDSPDLSPHLRSRLETQRELGSGAVPLTTLRAAIVIGRGSAGFETIVVLAPPRDAGQGVGRAAAHRGAEERDRGQRRQDPHGRSGRAHALRRGRSRRTRPD